MDFITQGILLDFVSDGVIKLLEWIFSWVGNYGWTVVVFTLVLKLAMSPLDIWQKVVMLRNNRAMKRMKPKLDKLQTQYANNKEMLYNQQRALYKQENYKMLGSCLPLILTLVIFITVFGGFNAMTATRVKNNYIATVAVYDESKQSAIESGATETEAKAVADAAVVESTELESWLWIKNVFIADVFWAPPIPSFDTFTGTGLGKLGVSIDTTIDSYNVYMGALEEEHSGEVNGYLVLPLIAIAISYISQQLMKTMQPQQPGAADPSNPMSGGQGKMLMIFLPLMMGFFALFYSSAFSIYLVVSQIISTLTQLAFNIFGKVADKRAEERMLATTYKR